MDQLEPLLRDWEGKHFFGLILSRDAVLPTLRNVIALAEALPLIRRRAKYFSGNYDDPGRYATEEDERILLETVQRRSPCNSPRHRQLRRFESILRDGPEQCDFGVRQQLSYYVGWPLKPDYSAQTVAFLKRLHLGLTSLDPVTKAACEFGFRLHTEELGVALLESLGGLLSKRDIPTIEVEPATNWRSRASRLKLTESQATAFVGSMQSYYVLCSRWWRRIGFSEY